MHTPQSPTTRIDDCWNRIGVVGDQSCAKLAQVIHCRNCEVTAAAAQHNLQRAVGDDYQLAWAAHFRQPLATQQLPDAAAMVLRIGAEWLALPTTMVHAVAPPARPHRLPHRSGQGLDGIVNVGGTLYPCLSLAAILGIAPHAAAGISGRHVYPRLLLVQWEQQIYALPVAELRGILRYDSSAMQTPAATINQGLLRFLRGVLAQDNLQIGVLDTALIGYQLASALR